MARTLLIRGLLVGLVAGLVAFVVARLTGESAVSQAIAWEAAHGADSAAGGPEPVSRAVQATAGLLTATAVYGTALGGLFAVVVAITGGRAGHLSARTTSGLVALAGFVACYLVPFVKYPPNPPGAGAPETIGRRTAAYFLLVAASVLLAVAAVRVRALLAARWGAWNAALAAAAGYVMAVALVMAVLPDADAVPDGFPAATLWSFRIGSLAT